MAQRTSNPLNKKIKGYKETQKKEYLWREQANLLGKDVDIIKTWYSSIRTRYGWLKKTRSGAPDEELTERDSWILHEFGFLQPHIIEVRKRTAVSVSMCERGVALSRSRNFTLAHIPFVYCPTILMLIPIVYECPSR